jgi:hypothetical protein
MVFKRIVDALLKSRNFLVEMVQPPNPPTTGDGPGGKLDEAGERSIPLLLAETLEIAVARKNYADDIETLDDLDAMLVDAEQFLLEHSWCLGIVEERVGLFVPGVVSVFLIRIEPASDEVDEWLWVLVGHELPSGYLVTDNTPNGACALEGCISLTREWIDTVKRGEPVTELYPVDRPSTPEWAEQLEDLVLILEKEILKDYMDDLVG